MFYGCGGILAKSGHPCRKWLRIGGAGHGRRLQKDKETREKGGLENISIPARPMEFTSRSKFTARVGTIIRRSGGAAILTACISLSFCGCAKERVWSTEVRSSDEGWHAVAESFVVTGPGTNSVDTVVRIERGAGFSRQSSRVLGVADAGPGLGLTMRWLTPRHLEIVLRDNSDYLYYQVVKTSGVDISLRYDYQPVRR